MGDSAAWFKRSTSSQFSRRFVLEELQPVPAHSTCRLQWHSAAPAAFGTTALPQRCSASDDSCLACASGFEHVQGTGICLQKCPHESVGPAHMCAVSRTCVRGDSVCPMVATEILFLCTAANQLLGEPLLAVPGGTPTAHSTQTPRQGSLASSLLTTTTLNAPCALRTCLHHATHPSALQEAVPNSRTRLCWPPRTSTSPVRTGLSCRLTLVIGDVCQHQTPAHAALASAVLRSCKAA